MVQGKINRDRHTDHPAGRHSIQTNQCPPPPSPHLSQAGCPSCCPTNSVKALHVKPGTSKDKSSRYSYIMDAQPTVSEHSGNKEGWQHYLYGWQNPVNIALLFLDLFLNYTTQLHYRYILRTIKRHTLSPGLMLGSPFGPTLWSRLNAIFCVRPNSFPGTIDSTQDSWDGILHNT